MTTSQPTTPNPIPRASDHRRNGWAWAILIVGLIGTAILARSEKSEAEKSAQQEFDSACSGLTIRIEDHLLFHVQMLRSAAAFFSSSDEVTREEWHSFTERQKLRETHPGTLGLGFALLVPPAHLAQHLQQVRAEGFPDYRVWPEGARESYTSIVYLEPFSERNRRAFGFDMFSEPVRRAAMERARDLDEAALSAKVLLVQESGEQVQAGVLLYVPVYRQGLPVTTAAERRAALVGWVYSPLRMTDLLQDILGRWGLAAQQRIRFELYDGETVAPAALLFDSQPGRLPASGRGAQVTQQGTIEVAGRHWLLCFTPADGAKFAVDYSKVWLLLTGGILTTVFFSGLGFSLANTGFNARRIAARLTADLQASETRWQFAIEGTGDGVWDWNVATNVVTYSKRWKEMLGCGEDEIGSTLEEWSQRVHPDDLPPAMAAVQAHLDGRVPTYLHEHRMRCKDGRWIWILDRGLVVSREADGKPRRLIGAHQDITERKEAEAALRETNRELSAAIAKRASAEAALRESQGFYHALVHQLPAGVFRKDAAGRYVFVSPWFCQLKHMQAEEFLGRTALEVVDAQAAQPDPTGQAVKYAAYGDDHHRQIMATGQPVELVEEYQTAEGRALFVNVLKSPVIGPDGTITGTQGIVFDITARKRAEEELANARTTLEAAFEQTPVAMVLVGLPDGVLRIANTASRKLLGILDEPTPVGLRLADFVPTYQDIDAHGDPVSLGDAPLAQALLGQKTFGLERKIVTKTGEVHWVVASGNPIYNDQGALIAAYLILVEITERKLAESALRESLAEKESLLREVHHRVKNNLQVITSLLRLESGRATQPGIKSVLGDIQGRIRSMALLHESLYRSGTFAAVDLGGYLKQIATQTFRSLVTAPSAVLLQLDLASASATVEMDQAMPCGLLVNELVTNCLKHGFPAGHAGEVRVELHRVDGGPSLCLRVSDTGIGLPADFEEKRGLSLGLQLVADLARQIGGRLETGPDTTFTITFVPQQNAPIPPIPT